MRNGMAMAIVLLASGCSSEAPVALQKDSYSEAAGSQAARPPAGPERLVVAFGDSLYAGYGVKPDEAWPAKLQAALWARGINARLINAGVSGDTTAAGRQRLTFLLDSLPRSPDLVIVGLGGNDMLRALPPAQARANLDAILRELDRRKIPAMLTGMLAAPNLGADYAREFNAMYPALAKQYDAALVPIFMASVIDRPKLFQPDRVHPTAAGIDAIVADTVDAVAAAISEAAPPPPR